MPAADWPIFAYGKITLVGLSCGIFFASVMIRLPLFGAAGASPRYFASFSLYHFRPSGWPTNPPTVSCLSPHAPFHGPWLSVKNTSPSALNPTPPGERTPLVVGTNLPSGVTLPAHPRNLASLVNDPVRQRVIQRFPSLSNREPMAYSW